MSNADITVEPGTQTITITREFAATPEQLLQAHIDPELLTRWLGPKRLAMSIEHFEAKNGGRWAYSHVDEDGSEYKFRGVFHGDPSVDGITQTFEFLGFPGVVSLETMTFEDLGNGRTKLTGSSVYPSVETRDGMAASGMETGINEGYDKLDEILATS